MQYDADGSTTGEAYVRLPSEREKQEALMIEGNYRKKFIESYETNEIEWNTAKLSQFPDKRQEK